LQRREKEGAGKGTLAKWLKAIFGSAMITAQKADQVVGRFNIQIKAGRRGRVLRGRVCLSRSQ
jgi:hypothetical protein